MTVPEPWTVKVDAGVCRGSGTCEGLASRHFALDRQTHKVVVLDETAPAGDSSVLDAAMSCPLEAISVTDAGGTPIYPEP